ncbi:hypothetical protein BS78_06G207400, partial [Paspalum vaginatum]
HGLQAREHCWLCSVVPESCDHLLFGCSFSLAVWGAVLARFDIQVPPAAGCDCLQDWWQRFRASWPASLRAGADTMFGLICWLIWKERNRCCFDGDQPDMARVLRSVAETAELWMQGGARNLSIMLAS